MNTYEKFWRYAYPRIIKKTDIFNHVKEWDKNYLNGETGYWQLFYKLAITKNEARAELFLGRYNPEENKVLFDELIKQKEKIEGLFGSSLIWERIDNKVLCRICVRNHDFHPYDEDEWPELSDYLTEQIIRLSNSMRKPLEDAFNTHLCISKSKTTY